MISKRLLGEDRAYEVPAFQRVAKADSYLGEVNERKSSKHKFHSKKRTKEACENQQKDSSDWRKIV